MESFKKPSFNRYLPAVIVWLLAILPIVGCQNAEETAPEAEVAVVDVEPAMLETVEPTPTTAPEEEAVSSEPAAVDHCLDCHTDKEMLIDTADPEEEVISENEGEG